MNTLTKLLFIGLFLGLFVACQDSNTSSDTQQIEEGAQLISGKELLEKSNQRSSTINMDKFGNLSRFVASTNEIDLSTVETIMVSMKEKEAGSNDDVQTMVTIFNTFMTAEKSEGELNLSFEMSDEPVESGVFLFSINTEENQDLAFQMYDEEGFELAADNQLSVKEGANYKALNVKNLDNGTYLFRLKNAEGQELVRKVEIQQN
ncbi:MAG: hypothetical protein GY810_08120 [Aureispira sp.]|nr:hypothetical protein [Aureispira sp.]